MLSQLSIYMVFRPLTSVGSVSVFMEQNLVMLTIFKTKGAQLIANESRAHGPIN